MGELSREEFLTTSSNIEKKIDTLFGKSEDINKSINELEKVNVSQQKDIEQNSKDILRVQGLLNRDITKVQKDLADDLNGLGKSLRTSVSSIENQITNFSTEASKRLTTKASKKTMNIFVTWVSILFLGLAAMITYFSSKEKPHIEISAEKTEKFKNKITEK